MLQVGAGKVSGVTRCRNPTVDFISEHDLEVDSYQGEPEMKISAQLKERLCAPWKGTLVVRLLGRSVSYQYLCSQLRWRWRPSGTMEILDLNNSAFLVSLGNEQDYLNALTGGPWVILDHYLIVHLWSHSFHTSDKPHRAMVAWVQLPELLIHFYHWEILFALDNLLGRTIKLDYHTEHLESGKFARLAVELDMTKPLKTRIRLDGAWQQVMYENLSEICLECGRFGHSESTCSIVHQSPRKAPQAQTSKVLVTAEVQSEEPTAGYGSTACWIRGRHHSLGIEPDGKFKLRIAYAAAADWIGDEVRELEEATDQAYWKTLWKWTGPNSIKHFLWLPFHDSLGFTGWLDAHLKKEEEGILFRVAAWYIWKRRNEKVFYNLNQEDHVLVHRIKCWTNTIRQAQADDKASHTAIPKKSAHQIAWDPPPPHTHRDEYASTLTDLSYNLVR
ncbi:unnamed protein product [Linum tenue]|uniref:CCHC-type domain-containing protein n=1 Tax=Linum tenue TaxID=586396 RepID=A0AAV0RLQ8_9ROSI|nr:unnamed protein product [Linum tenue]